MKHTKKIILITSLLTSFFFATSAKANTDMPMGNYPVVMPEEGGGSQHKAEGDSSFKYESESFGVSVHISWWWD